MRLLNTATWQFHNRGSREVYCILSHRWDDDDQQEIHYEDAKTGNWKKDTTGYEKIAGACQTAQELGYEWIWIDTCCIKRESDSELSEAINSMYQWYAEADMCLAYLSDVPVDDDGHAFAQSAWFTRGWTLQEMLAPSRVAFYSRSYRPIGTKAELCGKIAAITGIAEEYLLDPRAIRKACVAHKLCWMSRRVTKRKEDESYCMLGLLGINMPLLYGERGNAFLRLQRELLEQSDDDSIFAWASSTIRDSKMISGLLAERPMDFARSGSIQRSKRISAITPYRWTHRGIQLYTRPTHVLLLKRWTISVDLAYTEKISAMKHAPVSLQLLRLGNTWYRVRCNELRRVKGQARFHRGIADMLVAFMVLFFTFGTSRQKILVAQPRTGLASSIQMPEDGAQVTFIRRRLQRPAILLQLATFFTRGITYLTLIYTAVFTLLAAAKATNDSEVSALTLVLGAAYVVIFGFPVLRVADIYLSRMARRQSLRDLPEPTLTDEPPILPRRQQPRSEGDPFADSSRELLPYPKRKASVRVREEV